MLMYFACWHSALQLSNSFQLWFFSGPNKMECASTEAEAQPLKERKNICFIVSIAAKSSTHFYFYHYYYIGNGGNGYHWYCVLCIMNSVNSSI